MHLEKTIQRSVRLAVRRPETGAALLARTFAQSLKGAQWVDRDMRLKFCILFLGNLIDRGIEQSTDPLLLERVERKSLAFGIRLLKRSPEGGLRMLVALAMKELRKAQNFDFGEQLRFYKEVLARFFPETYSSAAGTGSRAASE